MCILQRKLSYRCCRCNFWLLFVLVVMVEWLLRKLTTVTGIPRSADSVTAICLAAIRAGTESGQLLLIEHTWNSFVPPSTWWSNTSIDLNNTESFHNVMVDVSETAVAMTTWWLRFTASIKLHPSITMQRRRKGMRTTISSYTRSNEAIKPRFPGCTILAEGSNNLMFLLPVNNTDDL